MPQITDEDVKIHMCTFQGHFVKAKLNLRFPCSFFIQWKSLNGKQLVQSQNKYKAKNSIIQFNQTLVFSTELLFQKSLKQYLKKQTILKINLVSASRPDQIKLVGQLTIDLSQIANSQKYEIEGARKLNYCSVDAELIFSVKMIDSKQINKFLNQLDRSAFNSEIYNIQNTSKSLSERSRSKSREAKAIVEKIKKTQHEQEQIKIVNSASYSNQRLNGTNQNPQKKRDYIVIQQSGSNDQQSPQKQKTSSSKQRQRIVDEIKEDHQLLAESHKNFKTQSQKSQVSLLSQENKTLKTELEKHYNKIVKLQSNCKSLIQQLEKQRQQSRLKMMKSMEEDKTALTTLKQKISEYQTNLTAKNDQIKGLSQQINNLNWIITKKDQQIASFETDNLQRQAKIKQLQTYLQDIPQKDNFQNEILMKNQKILLMQQKIKEMETICNQNIRFSQRIKSLQIDLESQKEINKTIQNQYTQNQHLIQKINALQIDLSQQKNIVSILQQKNRRLEQDLNQLNAFVGTQAGLSQDYSQQNIRNTLKDQIQKIINQKSQIKKENEILKEQNAKLILSTKSKPENYPEELTKIQQADKVQKVNKIEQIPQYKITQNNVEAQYQRKLKKIQQKYRTQYDRMCTEYQEKIRMLKQEFDRFTQQVQSFKNDLIVKKQQEQKQLSAQNVSNLNQQQKERILQPTKQINQIEKQENNSLIPQTQINQNNEKDNNSNPKQENIESNIEIVQSNHQNQHQSQQHRQIIQNNQQKVSASSQKQQITTINQNNIQKPQEMIRQVEYTKNYIIETQKNEQTQNDQFLHPAYYKSQIKDLQAKLKIYEKEIEQLRANQFYPEMKQRNYEEHEQQEPVEVQSVKPTYQEEIDNNFNLKKHSQQPEIVLHQELAQHHHDHDQIKANQSQPHQKQNNTLKQNTEGLNIKIQVNEVSSMNSSFYDPQNHNQITISQQDYLPRKIKFGRAKKQDQIKQQLQNLVQTKKANSLKNSQELQRNVQVQSNKQQRQQIHKSQPNQKINQSQNMHNIISELSQSNAQIREQSMSLNQQYEEKVAEQILLQEKIKQLKKQNERVNALNADLQNQLKQYENNIRQLQKNIQEMCQDSKIKDNVIFDMEQKITETFNLKFQLSELMEVKAQLENTIKARQQKNYELEQTVNQLKKQLQTSYNDSQYLKLASKQDHQPKQSVAEIQPNKADYKNIIDSKEINTQKDQKIRILQEKINQIQSNLRLVQQINQQIKQDNNLLKQQNKNLQTRIQNDKGAKIDILQQNINEKEYNLKLQEELKQEKQKNHLISNQKTLLEQKISNLLIELENHHSPEKEEPFNARQSEVKRLNTEQNNQINPVTPFQWPSQAQKIQNMSQSQKWPIKFEKDDTKKYQFQQSIGSYSEQQVNLTTTKSMNEMQKQIQEIRGELDILREQLISQSQQHNKLKEIHSRANQSYNQLLNRFTQMENSHRELQESHKRLTESHEQLQKSYKQMKSQYKEYRDTYQEQINKWIIMKQQSKLVPSKIQQKNTDKKSSQEVSQLSQKILNLQYQNKVLNRKLSEMQSKGSLANQSLGNNTQFQPAKILEQDEILIQKQNLLKQKQEIIKIKDVKITQLQNLLTEKQTLLKEKDNSLNQKQNLLNEKSNNNQEKQSNIKQIQELTLALQEKQVQSYTQQAKILQLHLELSKNAQIITQNQLQLQKIKPELNDLKAVKQILQEQVNLLSSSLDQTKLNKQQTQTKLKDSQQFIQELQNKLNSISQNQNNGLQLNQQIQTLRQELQAHQNRIQELLQQKSELSEQANSIDTLLKQSEEQIKILKDTISGLQSQNQEFIELKQLYQSTIQQLNTLKSLSQQNQQKISQLETTLNQTKLEKDKKQVETKAKFTQCETLKQDVSNLKSQSKNKDASMKELKTTILNLQQKIDQKDGSIIQLTFSLEQITNKNRQLLSYIEKYQKKQQMMKEHLIMLQEQSNRIFTMVKDKEIQQGKYIETIQNLQSEMQTYKIMNLELNESLTDKINRITFLSEKQKTTQFVKSEDHQSDKIKQLTQTNQKLLQKNKEYLELLSRKTSAVIQNQKLKHVVQKLQDKNSRLDDELNSIKKKHEEKLNQIFAKCKEMQTENKKLKQKVTVNAIRTELNQLNTPQNQTVIVKPLQSIIQEKSSKIQQLSSKLKQAQNQSQKLKLQNQSIKQKHSVQLNLIANNQKSILELKSRLSQHNTQINDLVIQKKSSLKKNQDHGSNFNFQAQNQKYSGSSQNIQKIEQLERQNNSLKSQIEKKNLKIKSVQKEVQEIKMKKITDPQLKLQRQKIKDELEQAKKRQEQYMITVLDLQSQLQDIRKSHSKQYQMSSHPSQNHSLSYSYTQANNDHIHETEKDELKLDTSTSNKQILFLLDKLKGIQQKRNSGIQAQKILKLLISKNSSLQSQLQNANQTNSQYGRIQQKAREVSCQLQKIKSTIIKSKSRDVQQKSQLIAVIRPCETVINQLIRISQELVQNSVILSGAYLR